MLLPMSCAQRVLSSVAPVPSKETQAEQGLSCVLGLWCVGPLRLRGLGAAVAPRVCWGRVWCAGVWGCVCAVWARVPRFLPGAPSRLRGEPHSSTHLIPKVCLACKLPAFQAPAHSECIMPGIQQQVAASAKVACVPLARSTEAGSLGLFLIATLSLRRG